MLMKVHLKTGNKKRKRNKVSGKPSYPDTIQNFQKYEKNYPIAKLVQLVLKYIDRLYLRKA
jgi:hypothetical protein